MNKNTKGMAELYGFKFNALSRKSYVNASYYFLAFEDFTILFWFILISGLIILSLIYPHNFIIYLGLFYFGIVAKLIFNRCYSKQNFNEALKKVNADHLLSEFDLRIDGLRLTALDDIKENGYFSAVGYWELYNLAENISNDEEKYKDEKAKNKSLKNKYPDVFTDD